MHRLLSACITLMLILPPFLAFAQDGAQPTSACTLVELQPGYPGFRGFVTGLYGTGEAACLEDLQQIDPWFDVVAVNAANTEAAARLGISGDASTWLWENWLAIEAERGMVPTCFQAARGAMMNGAPYLRATVPQLDPRLLVGQPGITSWIDAESASIGTNMAQMRQFFIDDALFRAGAWTTSGRLDPNAWELLDGGASPMELVNTPGGGIPATYSLVIEQGGYVPVPANACPEDQGYLARVTMGTIYWSNPMAGAYLGEFDQHYSNWLNDVAYAGGNQSLREYLVENWEGAP